MRKDALPASCVSTLEPWRELVTRWHAAGIQGSNIHATLKRNHGYTGSYSSLYRLLNQLVVEKEPEVPLRLVFQPAEAMQVDFGAGPLITDVYTGEVFKTWFFVATLAWSRHQYAEFVRDQTVATWLGGHRRAFEWFGGCVSRVIIDNAKCAITKACVDDPQVQRVYAECAEGYNVLFATQTQLLGSLRSARATGTYERRFQQLVKVPLLICDDFGLKPLRSPENEDFHGLVAERYERTATVLTSNLDFAEWGEAFASNKMIGAATLDRLRHGAYRVVLDGKLSQPATDVGESEATKKGDLLNRKAGLQPPLPRGILRAGTFLFVIVRQAPHAGSHRQKLRPQNTAKSIKNAVAKTPKIAHSSPPPV